MGWVWVGWGTDDVSGERKPGDRETRAEGGSIGEGRGRDSLPTARLSPLPFPLILHSPREESRWHGVNVRKRPTFLRLSSSPVVWSGPLLSLAVHSLILSLHQVLQLQPCNTLNLLSVGSSRRLSGSFFLGSTFHLLLTSLDYWHFT